MKSTQLEIQKRVAEILEIRLQGAEWWEIVKYAEEKGWQVKETQLRNYMRRGDALLAQSLERDREKLLDRHHAQRRQLYARAMSVSDYGTALRAADSEAKLLGLLPAPAPTPPPSPTHVTINVTLDQRRAELLQIFAAISERIGSHAHPGASDGLPGLNGHAPGNGQALPGADRP